VEIIALILVIVLAVVSNGKKKGKAPGKSGAPGGLRAGAALRAGDIPRPVASAEEIPRPVASARAIGSKGGIDLGAILNTVESAVDHAADRLGKELEASSTASKALRRAEPVVRAVPSPLVQQGEAMLADEDCFGGSMEHTHDEGRGALEDEDCFGGSMEHSHTEGVSREDHARRMAAMDADRSEALRPEAIDARALRRAVVMAEVLGRPRALQPRRGTGAGGL